MANGLTRPLNIEARAQKKTNIIEDIFGTPAERIQQRQLEAAQEIQQEQRVQKQKESDYRLFMQFERNFEKLTDKRSLAEQMGLNELVAGMDNKYDFGTIQSEEQLLQDMTKAVDSRELVQIYSNIRDDSYYSDKALTVAESRMKEFGNILPKKQRTDYDLNKADYIDGVQAIQYYEQLKVNTKEPYANPQVTVKINGVDTPMAYDSLVKLINDEYEKQDERLKQIETYENNFNNQFQYALSQFAPKPESPTDDTTRDDTTRDDTTRAKSLGDDFVLDPRFEKTLESLDISSMDVDLSALEEGEMETMSQQLQYIEDVLKKDTQGEYFDNPELPSGGRNMSMTSLREEYEKAAAPTQEEFMQNVNNLQESLTKIGVDVSQNDVIRLLSTAEFGESLEDSNIYFGGPGAISDEEREGFFGVENRLKRKTNRLERSRKGEKGSINPKLLEFFGTEERIAELQKRLESPEPLDAEDLLRMLFRGE